MKEAVKIGSIFVVGIIVLVAGTIIARTRKLDPPPLPMLASSPKAKVHDPWSASEAKDRMDGTITRFLIADSDESMSLILRCKQGTLDVLFNGSSRVLDYHDNEVPIRLKLDDFQPSRESWRLLTTHEGFAISGSTARRFVKDLAGSRKLLLQYPLYLENDRIATFDVSGLQPHLETISACTREPKPAKPYHPKVGIRCGGSINDGCYDEANIFHPKN